MKAKNIRLITFVTIIIMVFLVIILRLGYLQIINGDYYSMLASDKAERGITEIAPRGEILDKNGIKIATNKQCFNITYTLGKVSDDVTNSVLLNTVGILTKNGEQSKINIQALPINYDSKTGKYEFAFNVSDQAAADKLAADFKKNNKIDSAADAKASFYKLAEDFHLVTKNGTAGYTNINKVDNDTLYRIVALRMALKNIAYKQYQPVYVANNIKKETSFEIEMKINDLPGIMCELAPLRYYPFGEVGSSFIGYLGKINSDLETYTNSGYDVSRELIGKDRLEGLLENNKDLNIQLRGEPGITYVQVDKYGRVIKNSAKKDPIPGDTVVTTIDMKLQQVAEKALDDTMAKISSGGFSSREKYPNANRGAVVVLNANTGEILALVSRPGYDPNAFAETGGIKDTELYKKYFLPGVTDKYDALPKPMFNYALSGKAPPGSTFKPLTAIAGLQEGVITPSLPIVDRGIYTVVKGFAGKCWIYDDYGTTHGTVNVVKALEVSCNYYFFDVGRRLGYSKLSEWAWKFGLGRDPNTLAKPKTGIEIEESTGSVGSSTEYKRNFITKKMNEVIQTLKKIAYGGYAPEDGTPEYNTLKDMFMKNNYSEAVMDSIGIKNTKARTYIKQQINTFESESSRPGDPLNTAIGQGSTSLTPLQMAQYLATILNGGTRYKAHLLKQVLNADGTVKRNFEPEVLNKIDLNLNYVNVIKEGMRKVNEEGTAANIFGDYPIATGGKTGTAQFGEKQEEVGRYAYGWFLGFAPYDKPEIVVAAVIYDGGHGNYVANVVKAVYDQYFGYNDKKASAAGTAQTDQSNKTSSNNNH